MLVAGTVEVDGGTLRRARLKVIEGFGKDEIHAFLLGAEALTTKLVTDDWPSHSDIPNIMHKAIRVGPMAAHIVLPWTHRLFSNLKRSGSGRLSRTAQDEPPAITRRVRLPLQSAPHTTCRVRGSAEPPPARASSVMTMLLGEQDLTLRTRAISQLPVVGRYPHRPSAMPNCISVRFVGLWQG